MALPKSWKKVTPFSKRLAMILFIAFPFVGFYLGTQYQHALDLTTRQQFFVNIPAPQKQQVDVSSWKKLTYYDLSYSIPSNWTAGKTGRDSVPYAIDIYDAGNNQFFLLSLCQNCNVNTFFRENDRVEKSYTLGGKKYVSGIFQNSYGDSYQVVVQDGNNVYSVEPIGPDTQEKNDYIDAISSTFKFAN